MNLVATRQPFVDGALVVGDGPTVVVHSPATEEPIAEVGGASMEQVEQAILAARRAFDAGPWPALPMAERIDAVRRLGVALGARRDQLVETVIAEAGCPRGITQFLQVGMALTSIEEACDLASRLPEWEHTDVPLAQQFVGPNTIRMSLLRHEPTGVAALITPYNFPFLTNVWKVVPALLAGCTAVLRPSPFTPLSATVFAEAAAEAELPPGVLNVVPEAGNDGGVLLTTHPAVDVVSFTGSTTVGRAIAAQAAPTLKRLILELGGKSVQLHLPDTFDGGRVDGAVGAAMTVFVAHAGQGCALQTRMLVPNDVRATVIEAVAAAMPSLVIGDPADARTAVGPLISCAQRDRVEAIVQRSAAEGARVVAGGRRPAHLDRGWFYEPTLIDAPSNRDHSAQVEVFGPVVTVLGYDTLDEAVAMANDHELGLSSGIYTNDLKLGFELAGRIRAGTVQVNQSWSSGYTPMGGFKQSGYGRERGAAGLRAFQELKHVVIGNR